MPLNTIKAFLIDVQNSNPYVVEIQEMSLDIIYKLLNCTCFDIAHRKIGSSIYDIFCDDEGLLKCNPILSAMSSNNEPMLVGNLLVTKSNAEGETISLADSEIAEIRKNLTPIFDDKGKYYPCLICDYE